MSTPPQDEQLLLQEQQEKNEKEENFFFEKTDEGGLDFIALANPLAFVHPDTWYNIPVCVVKAFTALLEHCKIQDRFLEILDSRQKDLTDYCNKRIAIFDERMSENSQRLYSSLDIRDQKIHDRFLKQQLDGEKFQKSMEQRIKDLVTRAETEREKAEQHYREYDRSIEEIQRSAARHVSQLDAKIDFPVKELRDSIEKQMRDLMEENLVIPGLVGEGQAYKNLRTYLSQNHSYISFQLQLIDKRLMESESGLKREASDSLQQIKNEILRLNQAISERIENQSIQLTSLGDEQSAKLKQDLDRAVDESRSMQTRVLVLQDTLTNLNFDFKQLKDEYQRGLNRQFQASKSSTSDMISSEILTKSIKEAELRLRQELQGTLRHEMQGQIKSLIDARLKQQPLQLMKTTIESGADVGENGNGLLEKVMSKIESQMEQMISRQIKALQGKKEFNNEYNFLENSKGLLSSQDDSNVREREYPRGNHSNSYYEAVEQRDIIDSSESGAASQVSHNQNPDYLVNSAVSLDPSSDLINPYGGGADLSSVSLPAQPLRHHPRRSIPYTNSDIHPASQQVISGKASDPTQKIQNARYIGGKRGSTRMVEEADEQKLLLQTTDSGGGDCEVILTQTNHVPVDSGVGYSAKNDVIALGPTINGGVGRTMQKFYNNQSRNSKYIQQQQQQSVFPSVSNHYFTTMRSTTSQGSTTIKGMHNVRKSESINTKQPLKVSTNHPLNVKFESFGSLH